jgi:peptide subunit release factor 1 (eRF1)
VLSRRVGVLLVRKGSYAVGLFDGPERLDSKVGSRHVQGRSAAGGWSQQRFARRRDDQAKVAYAAAADVAHRILAPVVDSLDALVIGGDDAALKAVLEDPRLSRLRAVRQEHLGIQDPKREFARGAELFRSVRLVIIDTA